MFKQLVTKLVGTRFQRELKRIQPLVDAIHGHEARLKDLSDADLRFTRALGLPTFEVAAHTLLKRLTFAARDGVIEHVWYPVFPPDMHAEEVIGWLASRA